MILEHETSRIIFETDLRALIIQYSVEPVEFYAEYLKTKWSLLVCPILLEEIEASKIVMRGY